MMVVRLYIFTRTSPVALLFRPFAMSTLPNLIPQSSNLVEGNETLPNVISITGQEAEAATTPFLKKIAKQQDVICNYFKDTPGHLGIPSCNSKRSFSSGSKNNSSANESKSSTSETSIGCSKESDLGKECSLSCVSSMNTSMTELLELRLEQDDEFLYSKGYKDMLVEHSLPTSFGKQESSKFKKQKSAKHSLKHAICRINRKSSKYHLELFDICQCETEHTDIGDSEYFSFLRSSRDTEDNAEEAEVDVVIEKPTQRVLRPGMVLLKNYISPTEQISIVTRCRELGLGPGGFYHPGYKDGSKLRLRMMCLGLDWDPQTRKYQKRRRIDRAKAPDIPSEFHRLVSSAMQDSLSLIREDSKVGNAEEILPQMTPDVCIVNFYTETGRLGLHQDRDESEESLSKGLPVVSFSIGDAAEFLYGNQRDVKKAEKLVLESGDVLIFGGESRHVFHGISSIIPYSAPRFLLEEARLRPGRLNLTFRQH